jgi:hypothetical protein
MEGSHRLIHRTSAAKSKKEGKRCVQENHASISAVSIMLRIL